MRDFQGLFPQSEQDPVRRIKWQRLDWFLRDLSRGMNRIQKGLVPDGSGNPIVDATLSDIYFVLKGRIGNQVGHGGTRPGGKLTFSSTLDPVKGLIYLGEHEQSAWDETNDRLGISTTAATAKVHIRVGDPVGVTAAPNADNNLGLPWSFVSATSYTQALSDSDDATFARWSSDIGIGGGQVSGTLATPSADPGTDTGFTLNIVGRSTHVGSNSAIQLSILDNTTTVYQGFINGPSATTTGADGTFSATMAALTPIALTAASAFGFGGGHTWKWQMNFGGVVSGAGKVYEIAKLYVQVPPAGGAASDTLQKWEAGSTSNQLSYANDANGNLSLLLNGGRFQVSASAFAMNVDTPASGEVAASTDSIGTVTWAPASSLATKVQQRWCANGYYRSDTHVDGAWVASASMTLGRATLYRRQGGSAGSLTVDLLRNGTTVFSSKPTIAFNAGASATSNGTISVSTITPGDIFTTNATADSGRPQDWMLEIEAS